MRKQEKQKIRELTPAETAMVSGAGISGGARGISGGAKTNGISGGARTDGISGGARSGISGGATA